MRNPLYVGSNPAFDVYVGVAESLGGGLNIHVIHFFFLKKNPPSLYIEKVHFNPPSIVIIHQLPVKKI